MLKQPYERWFVDLIQESVTFTSAIESVITINGTASEVVNIETDPADATIKVESDTTGVATATYETGKLTITGVKSGSAIVKITASKADCADGVTHILVIVK